MATKTAPEDVSNERLIQAIVTGQLGPAGLTKMRALAALRQRESAEKADVFSSVLANRQELPRYKHMAIMGLYELGGPRAEKALAQNIQHVGEHNAATVAEALGRIGSANTMPIIEEMKAIASEGSRLRATFAASLLAYRHNLDGHEVLMPGADQLMRLAGDSDIVDMKIRQPSNEEIEKAMAALKREPVDLSLVAQDAQQIDCGPNTFLFLWNLEIVNQRLEALRERKAVVGLLSRRNRFQDIGQAYSLSGFVLGTPRGDRVQLTIHHTSGEVKYAGTLEFSVAGAQLDLYSADRPGATAIQFSGVIREGHLEIGVARSAASVHRRLIPERASVIT